MGWCQVYGDSMLRKSEARIGDGRFDPLFAFFNRHFGQTDGGKIRQSLGNIRRMGRDSGADDTLTHIVGIGQAQMLARCDITEKIGTGSGSQSASYG